MNTWRKDSRKKVVAANFNIYEDSDDEWSVEIVGTGSFDEEDEDWECDEITDLGSTSQRDGSIDSLQVKGTVLLTHCTK